jgi:hypothetical protein
MYRIRSLRQAPARSVQCGPDEVDEGDGVIAIAVQLKRPAQQGGDCAARPVQWPGGQPPRVLSNPSGAARAGR